MRSNLIAGLERSDSLFDAMALQTAGTLALQGTYQNPRVGIFRKDGVSGSFLIVHNAAQIALYGPSVVQPNRALVNSLVSIPTNVTDTRRHTNGRVKRQTK